MTSLAIALALTLAAALGVALGVISAWIMLVLALLGGMIGVIGLRQQRDQHAATLRRIEAVADATDPRAPPTASIATPPIGTPPTGTPGPEPSLGVPPAIDAALARLARAHADQLAALRHDATVEAAITEALPDPVVLVDATAAVIRRNQAARQAFGADLPAILRHPALRAALDQVRGDGQPATADLSLTLPSPRELRATVIPLAAPRQHAAIVLEDHSRDLMVERMRADFVANVSHELRTPLTMLLGFTETLQDAAADDAEARAQFLAIMVEQGRRMSRLIDDLLSLSRIELVEHQPPSEPVYLAALIPHVLTFYGDRTARIAVAAAADLPAVTGDSDQLVQVLQNLIDNALKYGQADGIVRVEAERVDAGGTWPAGGVVLRVADQGAGIAAEHLPRLTERFYRVDKARSRSAGGTGLGLAIVKHIVSRHRGQLRIASTEGVGTTVSIWLPVALDTPPGPGLVARQ